MDIFNFMWRYKNMVTGKPKFKDEDNPQIVDSVTAVDSPKNISEHYWDRKMTAQGTSQLVYVNGSKSSEGEKKMIKPIPIILATTNATKIRKITRFAEIWQWEHRIGLRVYTPNDIGIADIDCPEIYYTFEQNAALKVDHMIWTLNEDRGLKCDFDIKKDPYIIMANDSGLEIPVLNNWPGVKTKRCCKGTDMTSAEYILYELNRKIPNSEDHDGYVVNATVAKLFNYGTDNVFTSSSKDFQDVIISRPECSDKVFTMWDICSPYRVYSNGYIAQCKTYTQMSIDESILYGDYMWKSFESVMKCIEPEINEYIERRKKEEEV